MMSIRQSGRVAAVLSFAAVFLSNETLGGLVEWPIEDGGNGHFYEAVLRPNGITWHLAALEAEAAGGYLATITSEAENDFVHGLVANDPKFWIIVGDDTRGPWLGGFQRPGSSEPDGGWEWVTGEPFLFTNWAVGEPNNVGEEDWLHFLGKGHNNFANTWNDLAADGGTGNLFHAPHGYIVEVIPAPSAAVLLALAGLASAGRRRR